MSPDASHSLRADGGQGHLRRFGRCGLHLPRAHGPWWCRDDSHGRGRGRICEPRLRQRRAARRDRGPRGKQVATSGGHRGRGPRRLDAAGLVVVRTGEMTRGVRQCSGMSPDGPHPSDKDGCDIVQWLMPLGLLRLVLVGREKPSARVGHQPRESCHRGNDQSEH